MAESYTSTRTLLEVFLTHGRVSTDSRRVSPGELFFALHGPTFDGNRYAAEALAKGAIGAVVDDPAVIGDSDGAYYLVEDTLTALQHVARAYRRRFHIPVIAITGSNGKTTTKELLAAVLGTTYPTHATRGNLNNHIGVPLTLLAMPPDTEVAIVEMGANHQGEIKALCALAEPTHGLVTNVGEAHLEGFGGPEGVYKGKRELYDYLALHRKPAFFNRSEPSLAGMLHERQPRIYLAESADAIPGTYTVKAWGLQPTVRIGLPDESGVLLDVTSQLGGAHNLQNIIIAATVGRYFKVRAENVKRAIEQYRSTGNRSELRTFGIHRVLLDAYNANPSSMRAALRLLADTPADHRIAVLGDMLELGDYAADAHRAVLAAARALPIDRLLLVGPLFAAAAPAGARCFADVHALRRWFRVQEFPPSLLLLKGSRGIGLEALLSEAPEEA